MKKRVKSTDPRKRIILDAFRTIMKKQNVTISKITDVVDYGDNVFAATLLAYRPDPTKMHSKYFNLGRAQIDGRDYLEAKLRDDAIGEELDSSFWVCRDCGGHWASDHVVCPRCQ